MHAPPFSRKWCFVVFVAVEVSVFVALVVVIVVTAVAPVAGGHEVSRGISGITGSGEWGGGAKVFEAVLTGQHIFLRPSCFATDQPHRVEKVARFFGRSL